MNEIDANIANSVADYLEENPVEVDLTGYATEDYVAAAIETIELTPGPQGPQGEPGPAGADGKDYVLTDADKQEIAGMVPGADVDLTDYYTKTEIDELLANLPTGSDLPASEEVEF